MAVLKTKISYRGKIIKKIIFYSIHLKFAVYKAIGSRFDRKVADLLDQIHVFIYVKIHFHTVGKIKTLYFMMGEDNHKKRGDRLLAMTSSSTTTNFISLSRLLRSWRRIQS